MKSSNNPTDRGLALLARCCCAWLSLADRRQLLEEIGQPRSKGPGRFLIVQAITGLAVIAVLGGCLPTPRHDAVTTTEMTNCGNGIGGLLYSALGQIDCGKAERLLLV